MTEKVTGLDIKRSVEGRRAAVCNLKNYRNKVRFGIVSLAYFTAERVW